MLKQNKTKDQKGFTIIEVLIVLAIAGLILLIVFLAVPALQRNSRNTSRRNDVSRILGAVQEVTNNSNGVVSTTTLTGGASGTVATAAGTLGYYDAANLKVENKTAETPTAEQVFVEIGAACTNGTTLATGTARQVAVLFAVETSGTATVQCTSS